MVRLAASVDEGMLKKSGFMRKEHPAVRIGTLKTMFFVFYLAPILVLVDQLEGR